MKSRGPCSSTMSSSACGAPTTQSANSGSVPLPGFSSDTRNPAPFGWAPSSSWIASAAAAVIASMTGRYPRARSLLLCREPLECLLERFVRLRAEHEQPLVEQEGRNAVDPELVRLLRRRRDPLRVSVLDQRGLDVVEAR